MVERIEDAPKNGDFIILLDGCSRVLGHWAETANGWVQPDGTPIRFSPTHWKRDLAPVADDETEQIADSETEQIPDDETEQIRKRPLGRLILALVAAIVCIGGSFWIASKESGSFDSPATAKGPGSVNSAAHLEREFSYRRSRCFARARRCRPEEADGIEASVR